MCISLCQGYQTPWCTSDIPWKERFFYPSTCLMILYLHPTSAEEVRKILSQSCFTVIILKFLCDNIWNIYGAKVILLILSNQHLLWWRLRNSLTNWWIQAQRYQVLMQWPVACSLFSEERVQAPLRWVSARVFQLALQANSCLREVRILPQERLLQWQQRAKQICSIPLKDKCLLRKKLHRLMEKVGQ